MGNAQPRQRLTPRRAALMQPPDYQWLMKNYRVRKVLELFCLLTGKKHRRAVLEILRAMQSR